LKTQSNTRCTTLNTPSARKSVTVSLPETAQPAPVVQNARTGLSIGRALE
jgi:hypothetical protein